MKQVINKSISAFLCLMMLMSAAPLSGFVGLELPEIHLPKLHLDLPALHLPDLSALFTTKAKAADATSGTCGSNLTWSYDTSTQTLTISGTGAMSSYSSSSGVTTAPWKPYASTIRTVVIEYGVTSISRSAFRGCNSLTEMTLPFVGKTATSTGSDGLFGFIFDYACNYSSSVPSGTVFQYSCRDSGSITTRYYYYYCFIPTTLRKVTISSSTTIPENAFYNCSFLTEIHLPDTITSIGSSAFSGCTGLTSITIPDSVTSIGNNAFYGCDGLTSVAIGNGVTSIGSSAFNGCTGLTSIMIPDSVTSIGVDAFNNTGYYNNNANWDANVLYLGHHLIDVKTTLSGAYSIRDNTISFANSAFSSCTGLTSVTIPNSVTSIGSSAFSRCTGLTSVTIPNSVTSIGSSAFYGCTGLTTITIPEGVTIIGDSAFSDCTGLTSINYNARIVSDLSSSFSNVFKNAGRSAGGITVTFGDEVERIPSYLFATNDYSSENGYFPKLISITIGTNVTSIGSFAFDNCTELRRVNYNARIASDLNYSSCVFAGAGSESSGIVLAFGDTVERIPSYLFYNSSNPSPKVKSVTIGYNVTSIGTRALCNLTGLINIAVAANNSVYHSSGKCLIKTASQELILGCNKSVIPSDGSVTSVTDEAFYNCTGLTSITIPDSVTTIGNSVFYGCTGLTSVTIPASVTSIGDKPSSTYSYGAFQGCTGLKTAGPIGGGYDYEFGWTTAIPAHAFKGCTGLTSVTIPAGVTSIRKSAFSGCTGLTSITIPASVTFIGSSAFSHCTGLTQINYNASNVADLGTSSEVFYNSGTSGNGITVAFGNTVQRIPAYLFYVDYSNYRPKLTSITIANGVTSIGDYAFYNCSGLTSITIPDGVTRIGSSAFYGTGYYNNNSNWEADTLYIGHHLIKSKTTLSGAYSIRSDTVSIIDSAFYNCSGLTSVTIPNSVTSIGSSAFSRCTGLTQINYNASNVADLTSTSGIFYNVGTSGNGISVVFGDSVQTIPAYLFYVSDSSYRPKLASVSIPISVTSIGSNAFYNCSGLMDIYYASTPSQWKTVAIASGNTRLTNAVDYAQYDGSTSHAWVHYGTKNVHLIFDSAGGSSVQTIVADAGTEIHSPAPPTKEGYTFNGWNPALPAVMPGDDLTVTAQWVINQYVLSIDKDNGEDVQSYTLDYGTSLASHIPSLDGEGGQCVLDSATYPQSPHSYSNNMNYTYSFSYPGAASLLLKFNSSCQLEKNCDYLYVYNGSGTQVGKYTGTTLQNLELTIPGNSFSLKLTTDSSDVYYGFAFESITAVMPEPPKPGYTFLGWDQDVPETMPDHDLTLTACWQANEHTITLDTNGGDAIEPMTVCYDEAIELPTPVKTGYVFQGWTPNAPETMPDEDLTFTASWDIGTYTITFDTDGGTPTTNPITAEYGTAITLPATPSKTGYTFLGWDQEIPTTMPGEDTTITALWEIHQHTITLNLNNGSDPVVITDDYGAAIPAQPDPAREGYTFTGWSRAIPSTMPDADLTINAQWQVNSYKLTYLNDDGTTLKTLNVNYGSSISAYTPTKTGYTFLGWDAEVPATMPAHDVTLTACWEIGAFTITYATANGTQIPSFTGYYGDPVPTPDNPDREGYTFTGWNKTIPATVPGQNLTITANWSVNKYKITYIYHNGNSDTTANYNYGTSFSAPTNPTREGYIFDGWLWPTADGAKPATMPAYNMKVYALWRWNVTPHKSSHTVTLIGNVQPTCTADGFSGRTFCQDHGQYIANEGEDGYTIPAYGHDYREIVVRAATCTVDGLRKRICNYCGETQTETIPATGHSRTNEAVTTPATCTVPGVRTVTCHCGYSWTEEIPMLAHTYSVSEVRPANCAQTGIVRYTCSVCGHAYNETVPKTSHRILTEDGTAATCTESGVTEKRYCAECGQIFTAHTTIPALGHSFTQETIQTVACATNGSYYQKCSRCGLYEMADGSVREAEYTVVPDAAGDTALNVPAYPETPHPYGKEQAYEFSYSYPEATKYVLKFSAETMFDIIDGTTYYDYLELRDANGSLIGKYADNQLAGKTVTVNSTGFSIKVVTDDWDEFWGFKLDRITVTVRPTRKVYTVTAPGHDYEQVILKKATCSEPGSYALRCKVCGAYEPGEGGTAQIQTVADPSTYPASPHPYGNGQTYNYKFTYPGATNMTVKFASNCALESSYDYVYLYNKSGSQIGSYTGTALQNKTVTVTGDSFSIKMTTDRTVTNYGFSIAEIKVTIPGNVKTYEIPADASLHQWVYSTVVQPTPLQAGQVMQRCTVCGANQTVEIPPAPYASGSTVSYGSYPQSRVTDTALARTLSRQSITWKVYDYFSGDGTSYANITTGNATPDRYMWYTDVSYGGERYRGVTFSKYRPISTGGIPAILGTNSNVDNSGYYLNRVYWFKYDPIQWRVLDPVSGLVICETVLDSQPFNNYVIYRSGSFYNDTNHYDNDYVHSSIRQWLNEDFYNTAFTDEQKANVLTTEIHNMSYSTLNGDVKSSVYDGANTSDKVFLLAYDDVINHADYGFSATTAADAKRVAKGSDYARCQGLYYNADGNSYWYLRTATNEYTNAAAFVCMVELDGNIKLQNQNATMFVGATAVGIRPAVRLKNISATGGDFNGGALHTVTYKVGGRTLGQVLIRAGDPMVLVGTSAPSGYAFSGWNAPEEMPDHDLTLTGEYLPIHTATFVADGVTVGTAEFTTASGTLYEPAVPEKNGFTGVWESYNLQTATGDITINAVYEAIPCDHVDANSDGVCDTCGEQLTYTKAINVNGVNLGIVTYTYNATEIQNLPAVPEKIGYTGQWDYTVNGSELTILPVYEPITYYATFMADGEQVGERIPFTVESSSIAEPQVPTKLGYSGRWRPYTLQASDITIIAEYSKPGTNNGRRMITLQQLLEQIFNRLFEVFFKTPFISRKK